MTRHLDVAVESFPIAGAFTIARGSRTEAVVVVATVSDGEGRAGRGECVPYARYGETVESVVALIRDHAEAIAMGATRANLQVGMKPGAARNALDCALWDLEAKLCGRSVAELLHEEVGAAEPAGQEHEELVARALQVVGVQGAQFGDERLGQHDAHPRVGQRRAEGVLQHRADEAAAPPRVEQGDTGDDGRQHEGDRDERPQPRGGTPPQA